MTETEKRIINKFTKKYLGPTTTIGAMQMEAIVKDFISAMHEVKMELIKKIDPFDLVEPCSPDCSRIEHAYHEGTWNAHRKLEEILNSLKSS